MNLTTFLKGTTGQTAVGVEHENFEWEIELGFDSMH